jgi:glycerol 3-phosphatase-1
MNLAQPRNLVVAEDVRAGKPGKIMSKQACYLPLTLLDPECYRLGMKSLGLDASADVLVIEDSPAGIRAGKAAGCKVLALATTHSIAQLIATGSADWIVQDLRSLRFIGPTDKAGVRMEISNTLTI